MLVKTNEEDYTEAVITQTVPSLSKIKSLYKGTEQKAVSSHGGFKQISLHL